MPLCYSIAMEHQTKMEHYNEIINQVRVSTKNIELAEDYWPMINQSPVSTENI